MAEQLPPREQTYYDRPVLKKPVWVWAVPVYLYLGSTTGAALVLGAATQLVDRRPSPLVRRCRWIGAAGTMLGTACLIYDLGRRERFLNMLRVFRPTSPMNMGSWILAAAGSLSSVAAAGSSTRGRFQHFSGAAGLLAGIVGLPLAGYTGVLLANSAIPIWQESRRTLPVLFIASGMAAAGSALELLDLPKRERNMARTFGNIGQAAEIAATVALQREVSSAAAEIARPFNRGVSSLLWRAAQALGTIGLVLSLWPGDGRRRRIAAGICGTAGALSLRFGILQAGRSSAMDPRATLRQRGKRAEISDLANAQFPNSQFSSERNPTLTLEASQIPSDEN